MSTTIRAELSVDNEYHVDKHRYYELKHFCLQYPEWRRIYLALDGFAKPRLDETHRSGTGDPTESCVEARGFYLERMELVEGAADATDEILGDYILRGVTEGLSYEQLKSRLNIPCCRDTYYKLYRKFFWLLDKARK